MYKQSHKRGKLLSADTFKIDIFLERDIPDQTLSQGDSEKTHFKSKKTQQKYCIVAQIQVHILSNESSCSLKQKSSHFQKYHASHYCVG